MSSLGDEKEVSQHQVSSHFQKELNISAGMASGLSAAYFGAYFLCPLTISGWILRHFGFRVTFMTGI